MNRHEAVSKATEAVKVVADTPIVIGRFDSCEEVAKQHIKVLEALGLIKFDEEPRKCFWLDPEVRAILCRVAGYRSGFDPKTGENVFGIGSLAVDQITRALAQAGYQITKTTEPSPSVSFFRELTDEEATEVLQTLWWTTGTMPFDEGMKAMADVFAQAGVQLVRKP